MSEPLNIGFIGLGRLGLPMSLAISEAGHAIKAYDQSPSQAAADAASRGLLTLADSPGGAAEASQVLVTSLPEFWDVEDVLLRQGAAGAMSADGICVDMSTGLPSQTVRIGQELAGLGRGLVDSPISSGGVRGAEQRRLVLTAGGSQEELRRVRPVLESVGTVIHTGALGTGHLYKLLSNQLGLGVRAFVAELLAFARAAGIQSEEAIDILSRCGAGNLVDIRRAADAPEVNPPTFRTSLAAKDLGYALDAAESHGHQAFLGRAAHEVFQAAVDAGFGDSEAGLAPDQLFESLLRAGSLDG